MVSVSALPRRVMRAVVVAAFVAVLVALLSVHSTAQADPYPPTRPTTSSTAGDPVPQQAGTPTSPRTTDDGSSRNLAETGFATLTATVIAVALLGGGVLLVVVGRRRGARKS
jgi:hypothetical protein